MLSGSPFGNECIGLVLLLFSVAMGVPLAFSLVQDDGALFAHWAAMAITLASAVLLRLTSLRQQRELQPRDGFLLVALVWSVVPAYGTLPLLFAIDGLSFTDAYFEAVSGLTTTGATVLTGLERLPVSINVWRCFMVLIGGMGIIVLTVAILPLLGVGGAQLFKAETAGPMKEEKLTPRMAETARGLWTVYFAFSLLCFVGFRWAGMSWSDAFMHMCSTMGLGGFSAYDASFGGRRRPPRHHADGHAASGRRRRASVGRTQARERLNCSPERLRTDELFWLPNAVGGAPC